jgi:glucose-6-phosphate 1-dehydrogenase
MSVTPSSASKLPASDYVIFGGTGDLSFRKIFPAFFWRYLDGQLTDDFRLFATSRRAFNIRDFAEALRPFCEDAFASGYATEERWQAFLKIIQIVIMDVANGDGVGSLVTQIREKASIDRPTIFYLAIAPSLFGSAVQMLKNAGLARKTDRSISRESDIPD